MLRLALIALVALAIGGAAATAVLAPQRASAVRQVDEMRTARDDLSDQSEALRMEWQKQLAAATSSDYATPAPRGVHLAHVSRFQDAKFIVDWLEYDGEAIRNPYRYRQTLSAHPFLTVLTQQQSRVTMNGLSTAPGFLSSAEWKSSFPSTESTASAIDDSRTWWVTITSDGQVLQVVEAPLD